MSVQQSVKLSAHQADLLRYLYRQRLPIAAEELDGRVAKALLARGLIEFDKGRIVPSKEGKRWIEAERQNGGAPVRRRGRRPKQLPGRAAAIIRAVEQLEAAIPVEAEVRVGPIQAAADDLLQGLRRYARELEPRSPSVR